jgi:predicted DNA-binding transcriptional regulator AlpA
MNEITFNNLPNAVSQLFYKLECIENLLLNSRSTQSENEKLLSVQQAGDFLNLAIPTIYGLTQRNLIPHSKRGKRLYFLESELREWVNSGKRKTIQELESELKFVIKKKGGNHV